MHTNKSSGPLLYTPVLAGAPARLLAARETRPVGLPKPRLLVGLRPVGRPAVLPRAPAPCSRVREEEATGSQPRATAGATSRRRPSGPAS